MTLEEELKLVEESKTGVRAFEQLYDFYIDKIYSYVFQRVRNKELSEDITSKVFLKAVENISKFDTKKGIRFGAWLYRTAHNEIIDSFRRKDSKNLELDESLVESSDRPERNQKTEDRSLEIALVLPELKDKYQQIISLKFFMEMEMDEIADVMGTKKSNVSVILHRALKDFEKKYIRKYGKSEIF